MHCRIDIVYNPNTSKSKYSNPHLQSFEIWRSLWCKSFVWRHRGAPNPPLNNNKLLICCRKHVRAPLCLFLTIKDRAPPHNSYRSTVTRLTAIASVIYIIKSVLFCKYRNEMIFVLSYTHGGICVSVCDRSEL